MVPCYSALDVEPDFTWPTCVSTANDSFPDITNTSDKIEIYCVLHSRINAFQNTFGKFVHSEVEHCSIVYMFQKKCNKDHRSHQNGADQ